MKFALDGVRPARAQLRDRRRGGLHPDRRGADAAHHLGPVRGERLERTASPTRSSRASRSGPGDVEKDDRGHGRLLRSTRSSTPSRSPRRASHEVEKLLGIDNLYDPANMHRAAPRAPGAERAHASSSATWTTSSKDGEVVIVDEFTGRMMPGRRWSRRPPPGGRGQGRRQDRAARTRPSRRSRFQNYFRMYKKLAGMTGTADTEADEFKKIYNLDVIVDPDQPPDGPRRPPRPGLQDRAGEVRRGRRRDQGVPRDAASRSWSARSRSRSRETLSAHAQASAASKHEVLNAKQHEREAEIVAQAGRYGAVTISTNMAGRGTDIVLGGNPEMIGAREVRRARPERPRVPDEARRVRARSARRRARAGRRGGRAPHPRHRAPRDRGASTTSCAAAPAARATRARRASSSRSKTT